MKVIRLGTRGSDLALWQARTVAAALAEHAEVELVIIETRGDRVTDRPLTEVGGSSVFTAAIEQALLDGRVDLAVHSHKDLGTRSPDGLVVAAVPARGPQHELLIMAPAAHAPGSALLPLREGARVGTGAPRRVALLAALRPDLEVSGLRGNVPTRVAAVRNGRLDAVVLAAAGVLRLELDTSDLAVAPLPIDLAVPAPAQGALAVQCRAADVELAALCRDVLHDEVTAEVVDAERSLLVSAGRGCDLPLGVAVLPVADEVDATQAWSAHAFLGAGMPREEAPHRWAVALGDTPAAAAAAAWKQLQTGRATFAGPLGGMRVAVTGAAKGGTRLGRRLSALGARVFEESLLDVQAVDGADLAGRLATLGRGDVVAVTSRHAAARLSGLHPPPGVDLAAVGAGTAEALRAAGLEPRLVGGGGAGELAEAILTRLSPARGARVLFPCAEDARPELPSVLGAAGLRVEPLVIYRTVRVADPHLVREVDARVYMSPSAVAASRALGREDAGAATRLGLGTSTCAALDDAGLTHRRPPDECADDVPTVGHAAVLDTLARLRAETTAPRRDASTDTP